MDKAKLLTVGLLVSLMLYQCEAAVLHAACASSLDCSVYSSSCSIGTCQCKSGYLERRGFCLRDSIDHERVVDVISENIQINAGSASFGYPFGENKMFTGNMAMMEPEKGCWGPVNIPQLMNRVALVWRGDCFFEQKAIMATRAGALAIIIMESSSNTISVEPMAPSSCFVATNATIPVVMVSTPDSYFLLDLLAANPSALITIKRYGKALGETCSLFQNDCAGKPFASPCSGPFFGTKTCSCNGPYFNQVTENGETKCVRDPSQNADSYTGRSSKSCAALPIGSSGCTSSATLCENPVSTICDIGNDMCGCFGPYFQPVINGTGCEPTKYMTCRQTETANKYANVKFEAHVPAVFDGVMVESFPVRSKLECSAGCSSSCLCESFAYNKQDRTCMYFSTENPTPDVNTGGWKFWKKLILKTLKVQDY